MKLDSSVELQSMRSLAIVAFLALPWVSGCISTKTASTSAAPSGAQVAAPSPGSPTPAPSSSPPVASVDKSATHSGPAEHPEATRAASPTVGSTLPKPNPAAAKPPIKPEGTAPERPAAPAVTSNKGPETPTLNLADLEQRLRDTHAIGVFTKLSLKNQVDDLLSAFRTLYKGPDKRPSAELRQRYDLLLLKVLSLLQDSDPQLAAAISSSREAIWGILSDPNKFAAI